MNPSDSNQQMLYSKSTGALLNRLRPQNENISFAQRGLNTLQPKAAIATSTSAPHLNDATQGSLKVSKLRSDVNSTHSFNKTLSGSPSAVLLSPNAHVRAQINDMMPLEVDYDSRMHNRNEMTRAAPRPEIQASKYDFEHDEAAAHDHDAKINVHKNSFIGSLNLTQKQLHDLYKVPQTFFYLRIREPSDKFGVNDLRSTQGGESGSVYDLELVSLDQVDKNNYFTLSKEGVTQFRNKVSQFTGLAQWEREYRLFHKIASINFFRIYKRWKVSTLSAPSPPLFSLAFYSIGLHGVEKNLTIWQDAKCGSEY